MCINAVCMCLQPDTLIFIHGTHIFTNTQDTVPSDFTALDYPTRTENKSL